MTHDYSVLLSSLQGEAIIIKAASKEAAIVAAIKKALPEYSGYFCRANEVRDGLLHLRHQVDSDLYLHDIGFPQVEEIQWL